MSNWRRQKPRNKNNTINYHQQQWTQSSNPSLDSCKLAVPTWEKEFCFVVGSVPWKKVLEAKRFMYLYDRVVQWDDSAGEEAFNNAKSRFWAEINGLSCDLSLPDQEAYIDDVDWDAEVDTELILDLERGHPEPMREGEEEEHVVILDALVLSEQYSGQVWGTGWGDAEVTKPENSWEYQKCDAWNDDSWGIKEKPESWDHKKNSNNNSFKTESWDHKKNSNNNSFKPESWDHKKNSNNNNFKPELWDHKNSNNNNFKPEPWDHKNNNSSFEPESWDHKKNNFKTEHWDQKKKSNDTNCFSYKKVHNWNGRDQGGEKREWRKREEPRGEDCRWKNGRGRSRGGFQQHPNGWGWTETF